jgi:two-component system response regulator DesR
MRVALRVLLERRRLITVVAEAGSGDEALMAVVDHRPDVLTLDLDMPGLNGLQVITDVRRLVPSTKIVVVTGLMGSDLATHCVRAGATAFVFKDDVQSTLVDVLLRIAPHGPHALG